ncbi:MAG: pyridoxamine 5'-phosphate oxidase family protein [Pseudomonadota bacterium]
MQNYADLLFSEPVKAFQEKAGMRDRYQQIYETRFRDDLDEKTVTFIEQSTSFYVASIGANDWPYVQHRGGPAGFVKVLGSDTIGFADYLGNRQFITQGNLETSKRVSLFFMDYPHRARLKMQGEATMISADADTELASTLSVEGQGPVERLTVIKILARDWNCPKYITPRFTEDEVRYLVSRELKPLVEENAYLKARIAKLEGSD